MLDEVKLNVVPMGARFDLGPFDIEFVAVTHSLPEPNALAIRTPLGTVLHTGDWKLDPAPMLGERSDVDALEEAGKRGVLAIIGDSTNALSPGTSGSEAEVRDSLTELIARQPNRVVLTRDAYRPHSRPA